MCFCRKARLCGFFFFSSRRRHTRSLCDWSSDVCSSDLVYACGYCHGARQARLKSWLAAEIGRASCRGKSVDLGGRRIIKKKKDKKKQRKPYNITNNKTTLTTYQNTESQ